ncbi:MAG: HAD family hydrolase, partial [Psychrobacillus psychrotolerans]
MKRKLYMLATDLDGTLVGDKAALQSLLHYYNESFQDISLVYITGRHLNSALSLIASEDLPAPDILITDLGTAIYTSPMLKIDKDWQQQMRINWQPDEILKLSGDFPTLKKQALPNTDRISFTVNNDYKVVQNFGARLNAKNIPHKLVYSSNRDVDILPENSGKGNALTYVLNNFACKEVQVLV